MYMNIYVHGPGWSSANVVLSLPQLLLPGTAPSPKHASDPKKLDLSANDWRGHAFHRKRSTTIRSEKATQTASWPESFAPSAL